jgi:hypothetical protein
MVVEDKSGPMDLSMEKNVEEMKRYDVWQRAMSRSLSFLSRMLYR